jgi:hypothetical protein
VDCGGFRGSESQTPSCASKPATLLGAPSSKKSKNEGRSQHEDRVVSRPPSIRSKTRSPTRIWLAVFRSEALHIGMRIVVRISSILN